MYICYEFTNNIYINVVKTINYFGQQSQQSLVVNDLSSATK